MRPNSIIALTGATVLVVMPAAAHAAYELFHAVVPMTFTTNTEQSHSLLIPAHDDTSGALQEVSSYLRVNGQSGSLNWTITNNTDTTVNNLNFTVQHQRSLIFDANNLQWLSSTGFSVSEPFSLAGNSSHVHTTLPSVITGGGGVAHSSGIPFEIFKSNGDTPLTLKSGFVGTPPAPHTITNVSGDLAVNFDVRVAFKYNANHAPTSTPISVGQSIQNTFDNIGLAWYSLDYSGGELNIDTFGSNVNAGGVNNTMLTLYDNQGNLIGSNDNADGGTTLSQLAFTDGELTNGTYFILVSGPDVDVSSDMTNFNANPLEMIRTTGTYRLNINIPEPTGLSLLAGAGWMLLHRRRRGQ